MAEFSASFAEAWKHVQGLMRVLQYAASELFLNFLLLMDAVFSYLLTKFARHSKLEVPCILCCRLDHIFGHEKPRFYCNLLCRDHRSEISSLFSCYIHGNLADGNNMCEECVLSFARASKSNQNMNRLLKGKFGVDLGAYGYHSSLMRGESNPSSVAENKLCSCCNKPWESRQSTERPYSLKPRRSRMSMPNIPVPQHLTHRENIKKMRERFSVLSLFRYEEHKTNSDSELDFPFSDDDDGGGMIHRRKEPKEVPPITLSKYFHIDANRDHDQGQQSNQKTNSSAPQELISLHNFPVSSNGMESTEKSELKFHVSRNRNPSVPSEFMSLVDAPSLFHVTKGSFELSQWNSDGTGTSNAKNRHEETSKSATTVTRGIVNTDQVANEVAPTNPTCMTRIHVLETTDGSKETEASEKQLNKYERLFPSDVTSSPEVEKKIQVDYQGQHDEVRIIDLSSSNGAHRLQETATMDTGIESIDGSYMSEIEGDGENVVDRLKRQIQQDKRCIDALYKELDEERNAAAIAANQAMAMITRLQEEKAALHMEALQYLRMMEEQAEHDVDALEKANDLLAEKEKEIQDMEADIEYFRIQLIDESAVQTITGGSCTTTLCNSSTSYAKDDVIIPSASSNDHYAKDDVIFPSAISNDYENRRYAKDDVTFPSASSNDHENPIDLKSSWAEFEDERAFISQCLRDLEKKIHHFAHPDIDSEEEENRGISKGESVENMETDEEPTSNWIDGDQTAGKETAHPSSREKCKEIDIMNIESEISDLNERLEALETDWNFLEHTVNFLQTGQEGVVYVREIARQLYELRNNVTSGRSQLVP